MKNFTPFFYPTNFWEPLYMRGSQEKSLGQKANVKFFRVDPYMLWESVCTPKTILTSIRAPDLLWKGDGGVRFLPVSSFVLQNQTSNNKM